MVVGWGCCQLCLDEKVVIRMMLDLGWLVSDTGKATAMGMR